MAAGNQTRFMAETSIRVPSRLTTDGLLGRRYLARFIDSVIITLVLGLVASAAGRVTSSSNSEASSLVLLPGLFIVWIGYGTVLESSRWQATVGKPILGLRVYNTDG
jgi:uncharacterized RDD family membrane protein YckC